MPYITREDGVRFIIPSYRDVLTAKKQSTLRKEIMTLSASYGEYVALQRKSTDQYEVAFSPDMGYLLGETVWHYFKRPPDLIYCEEIPNTAEAILVIVRAGIVYLDGNFPIDTITDELISFRTQQIDFEIYIYGDVPISETPDFEKFALDAASIKSFTVLETPIFPILPTLSSFQLQLVDGVLNSKGIAVFPTKKILLAVAAIAAVGVTWFLLSTGKNEIEFPQIISTVTNPYQSYINNLSTPNPAIQVLWIKNKILLLQTIPGWYPELVVYNNGKLQASVRSDGARTNLLFGWASHNNSEVEVAETGFVVTTYIVFPNRAPPRDIYRLDRVVAALIDYLSYIIPGNNLVVGAPIVHGSYVERQLIITFSNITASTLDLIAQKLENLPLVLLKMSVNISDGNLSGSITFKALGS